MPIPKQRLITGTCLITVFTAIILSGKSELILAFLMLIPTKVFQELRRIHLGSPHIQQQKVQTFLDWALYSISLCAVINIINFDIEKLYYCFLSYLGWFVFWIVLVLDKNWQDLPSYILHVSWIHLALIYTLTQPILILSNIKEGGLFWFIFPCSLIICNDIAAYFCGKFFGRRRLLNISPNKTLEGYIGAIFVTTVFSMFFGPCLCQFKTLFIIQQNPQDIRTHAIYFALFASLFAPFGGFFASALKRASNIKDFDNFLPGHGGFTDRVDCHLFVALFTYLYYNAFVIKHN